MNNRSVLVSILALGLAACAHQPAGDPEPEPAAGDFGLMWVKSAGEYRAVAMQVYRQAEHDLPQFLADATWSAMPDQRDAGALPPAVIFDVDETVVSGVDFQVSYEPPFTNAKHDEWNATHAAVPVPGFAGFARAARAAGVELFFITNRPCEPRGGHACPAEQIAVDDVAEAGIETDAAHMLLAFERPEWTKEKSTRREHVARTHRVLMVFGDDLGDFIPCTRARPAAPCETGATIASRNALIDTYGDYFGHGWYILPNPMHGSWTTVR